MTFDDSSNQTTQPTGSSKLKDSSVKDDSSFKVFTPPDLQSGDNCTRKTTSTSPPGAQHQSSPENSTINHQGTSEGSLIEEGTIQPPQNRGLDLVGQSTERPKPTDVSVDGITNPHVSSLAHSGPYSYPSPADSNLPSPGQGTTSIMGHHPVTQQISYLRQTRHQDNQLGDRPTQQDNSLYNYLVQGGHSEGFTTLYEGSPPKTAQKTLHSHLSPYSEDKAPSSSSSLGGISEKNAHIPPSHDPTIHRASVHSPSSKLEASHEAIDLHSGAFTSSGFGSRFNSSEIVDNYGLDCGHPDLDLTRNNDTTAIKDMSSLDTSWQNNIDTRSPKLELGLQKSETVFAKGGYYSFPVLINIPRNLTPLPAQLLDNPMNLLYFHHFLNHTARILVPHDCSDNPFRVVLPSSKFSSSHPA